MLRVLHVSDVHFQRPLRDAPLGDLLGKRLVGGANLVLRRARHFRDAPHKLALLAELARRERVDAVILSGDHTALGTWDELRDALDGERALIDASPVFVTVPGNHDVYVETGVTERRFESVFGALLQTDLPEYATGGPYPSVRLVGDDLAIVAVDSARPNPQPWRSSGRVPDAQIDALHRIAADARVLSRFVLVVTHYALVRRDGTPDTRLHGLDNADALAAAVARFPRAALLHGHVHWTYTHDVRGVRTYGAGSATHEGREGFWLYELDGALTARRGRFEGGRYCIDGVERVT